MKVTISPYPCQHLLFSFLKIIAVLEGVELYLTVVMICISLMTNGVQHFCMCLLAICIFSLEECLVKSFARFLIGLFVVEY